MIKKILRCSILTLCLGYLLDGTSQKVISGTVYDNNDGSPLMAANVFIKDLPSAGTVTDIDGSYTLEIPDGTNNILVFSYTGYTNKEISIGNESVIIVRLDQGEILEDIVVIGYGTVKREDVTGSLLAVSSKDFNKGAITSPQQLLAGKVAGVTISAGGDPGSGAAIRIRGESSISASNDPLIVIDGVPLDNGGISGSRNNLNIINPNDIESMTVLKDASATAIYGNRASAGVILITTKKGSIGNKIRVGYNGSVSIGKTNNRRVDMLPSDVFRELVNTQFEDKANLLGESNTNWQDLIYQDALTNDHNLSLSGGVGAVPYRVSLGYTDAEGLLKTDNFNRWTGSLNLNPKLLNNRLQMNLGLKAMRNNNDFADRGAIGNANSFDPTQSPYADDPRYGGFFTWKDVNGVPVALATANPLALLNQVDDQAEVNRYILSGTLDYRFKFLPDLRANLALGTDLSNSNGFRYIDTLAAFNPRGTNNKYTQDKKNELLEFYLNYKKELGVHGVDFMAGYSWQRFFFENTFNNANIADTIKNSGRDAGELFLLSMFGRANYSLGNNFTATVTLRGDGTSRFAPENRWGLFPSAALAYKIIDKGEGILNKVKARASWGVTGQQDIGGYYLHLGTYELSQINAAYLLGDVYYQTIRANGYDSKIKWETTTTYNFGFDIGFLKNRLSTSIDFYQRLTEDLLIRGVPLAAGTNLTNILDTNVGSMKNQGVEITLNATPVVTKDLQWTTNLNLAYNKNEVTKLRGSGDEDFIGIPVGGIAGGVGSNIQIHTIGYSPYSFYVFEQQYDESGAIIPGKYVDRNEDGTVNEADKYHYKQRQPDFVIGFASSLDWKNLDFSFAGRSYLGNYMYNNIQTDMGWLNRIPNTSGTLTNIHRSGLDNNIANQSQATFSDHFITKASFLKVDHITLGYKLDQLINKNVRLYFTVQNPFFTTKYGGLDPEEFSGIDNNLYPRPTNYVFGLNANF